MMIVLFTFNCSLVPLIEGLWSSNPLEFEFSGFRRNHTDDLGTNSPSLWPTKPRLHMRSDCGSHFTIPADATIVRRPKLDALWAYVTLYITLHVHIVHNVLIWSLCGWPRKSSRLLEEGHNHPIRRFAYLCHVVRVGKEFVILSFLYITSFLSLV